MKHSEHRIKISTGSTNLGKVQNKTVKWSTLVEKLSNPLIDLQHTLTDYLALPLSEQSSIKNVGFFVGGQCDKGIRKIGHIQERWLVCLDIDESTPELLDILDWEESKLAGYEFFSYSTRKHTFESPRLRIVIPLSKPVEADAYHALARICGEMLKPDMEGIDPVSYRVTQLMYYPSVCKGADFYKNHNQGELMDPEVVLNQFGDWRDHTKLPRSESDSSHYVDPSIKPEDPESKEGIIGAFCRVYNVPAAISKFLPAVYIDPKDSSGSVRYTYAKGTTFHGAVVYDNGKLLYSNHMHDPASGHSQNAFDLVRIHLYGDLDGKTKDDVKLSAKPSYKKMLEMLKADDKVKRSLIQSNYDVKRILGEEEDDSDVFEDLRQKQDFDFDQEDTAEQAEKDEAVQKKATKDDGEWLQQLTLTEKGTIEPTVENIVVILRNDPRFKGVCRYNELRGQMVLVKDFDIKVEGIQPIRCHKDEMGENQKLWSDLMDKYVHYILEADRGAGKNGYKMVVSEQKVLSAIQIAFENDKYNPIANYLEATKWDGKPRVETMLIDYMGCPDDLYHRTISKMTLIAAVTRTYEPGHKFDQMLIVEGKQGINKSTFFKELALGCFGEMTDQIDNNNRAIESMWSKWILEFGELHQFKRAEVARLKQFLSCSQDQGRLAYERKSKEYPRRCIFVGTTNEQNYLKDKTGGRRFWPCTALVDRIDIQKLIAERDQIWAEALVMYRKMREEKPFGTLELVPRGAFVEQASIQQANRVDDSEDEFNDIVTNQIVTFLNSECTVADAEQEDVSEFDNGKGEKTFRTKTCVKEIWDKALRDIIPVLNRQNSLLISRCLRSIPGWDVMKTASRMGRYGVQKPVIKK